MLSRFREMRLRCHIPLCEVAAAAGISIQRLNQFETRYYGFMPRNPERLINAFEQILAQRKKEIERAEYICRHEREQLAEEEPNESCREMIEDNIAEVEYLADREALTRRFFIVLQYEQRMRLRGNSFDAIIARLNEEADTARHYLDMCGLEVLQPEYKDLSQLSGWVIKPIHKCAQEQAGGSDAL